MLLDATATRWSNEMQAMPGVVAPRINADMRRPELIIKPRLDLAAQLGVTTSALSQAIRIATIGDIDQNSAKFSLSDRQVPIRVDAAGKFARATFRRSRTCRCRRPAADRCRSARVAEISFGSGPTTIQRYNQSRRIFVGADLAPGAVKGDAMDRS